MNAWQASVGTVVRLFASVRVGPGVFFKPDGISTGRAEVEVTFLRASDREVTTTLEISPRENGWRVADGGYLGLQDADLSLYGSGELTIDGVCRARSGEANGVDVFPAPL